MKPGNILVAGSSGIIGSVVYKTLKENYSNVFGVGAEEINDKNYSCVDLTNLSATKQFVQKINKPDVLVYFVGLAHEKGKNKQIDTFRLINCTTIENLISSLKESKKLPEKIIFSSTVSVYGEKYDQTHYDEDSMLSPKSPYAVTKVEVEKYLTEYYCDRSWILRFAPVYTPAFKLNIERRTRIKGRFYRIGNSGNKLSLLSIENIKEAITGIIDGNVPAGIYNISDEKVYSFKDLLLSVNAKNILMIPRVAVKALYLINKLIGNQFILENSIKLLTDNIYPSNKIQKYIKLKDSLIE